MLSTPDGPFINLARLNIPKYAARPTLAKALFEYIFHHENDVRNVSANTVLSVMQVNVSVVCRRWTSQRTPLSRDSSRTGGGRSSWESATTGLFSYFFLQIACSRFLTPHLRLGMFRDAERQFKSAQKQQDMIDAYLYLCKVYTRLDQPLTAIDAYNEGLQKFPGETSLLTGIARIYEVRCCCVVTVPTIS